MQYGIGLGVLVLFHFDESDGAGLPIGKNIFCLLPTVNGDCVTFIGDVP